MSLVNLITIDILHLTGNVRSFEVDGASCVAECDCLSHSFEPVCAQNGLTYFSPCRAGCFNTTDSMDEKVRIIIMTLLY